MENGVRLLLMCILLMHCYKFTSSLECYSMTCEVEDQARTLETCGTDIKLCDSGNDVCFTNITKDKTKKTVVSKGCSSSAKCENTHDYAAFLRTECCPHDRCNNYNLEELRSADVEWGTLVVICSLIVLCAILIVWESIYVYRKIVHACARTVKQ